MKDTFDQSSALDPAAQLQAIDDLLTTLRAILDDKKPLINPDNPSQAWIKTQLEYMRRGWNTEPHSDFHLEHAQNRQAVSKAHYLHDVVAAFITEPEEPETYAQYKGQFPAHPLPAALHEGAVKLLDEPGIQNYAKPNIYICGALSGMRRQDTTHKAITDAGENIVLLRGDVHALYQFLTVLKAKHQGELEPNARLYIQNTGAGFWNPFLQFLKQYAPSSLSTISVTKQRRETAQKITAQSKDRLAIPTTTPRPPVQITKNAVFLCLTSSRSKIKETQKSIKNFSEQYCPLVFAPFRKFFPKQEKAIEITQTYVGNAQEKIIAAIELLRSLGRSEVEKIIKVHNLDPNNTFFLSDDRGLETHAPLVHEALAIDVKNDELCNNKVMNKAISALQSLDKKFTASFKPLPGIELANFFGTLTIKQVIKVFEAGFRRIAAKQIEKRGNHDHGLLHATNIACFSAISLNKAMEIAFNEQPINFEALKDNTLNSISSEDVKVITGYQVKKDRFSKPAIFSLAPYLKLPGKEKSLDEMGDDYIQSEGFIARGLKVLLQQALGNFRPSLTPIFKNQFTATAVKPNPKIVDIGTYIAQAENTIPTEKRLTEKSFEPICNTLLSVRHFITEHDGFIFSNKDRNPLITPLQSKIQQAYLFYTLLDGQMIYDPEIDDKPITLAFETAEDEKILDPLLSIYERLFSNGLIGEEPNMLYRAFRTYDEAKYQAIEVAKHTPQTQRRDFTAEQPPKLGTDKLRVTLYGSASSTNADYQKLGYDMAYTLGSMGCLVITGGGVDGVMGAMARGIKQWIADNDNSSESPSFAAIQCLETKSIEGLIEAPITYIAANKHERVALLSQTDVEILLPGGTGTVEEFFSSLYLRSRKLVPVHNRPLIVVNENGVYDALFNMFDAQERESLNLHFVDLRQTALDKVAELQKTIFPQQVSTNCNLKHDWLQPRIA